MFPGYTNQICNGMSCRILHLGGYNPCCLQTFKSPADVQIQNLNGDDQKSIQLKQVRKQTCHYNKSFNVVSALVGTMSASKRYVRLSLGGSTRRESRGLEEFFIENWVLQSVLVQRKTTRFP